MPGQVETNDDRQDQELTEQERQEKRRQEWGLQFDRFLIKHAKNKTQIELFLDIEYPGITENNLASGIPLRVDKYFLQMSINDENVWINKHHIIGCKQEVEG